VRFMVERVAPQLGETVLDPACGTGGFLVEAYDYLKRQRRKSTDEDRLQNETLHGVEKKPMPYLLGTMNMILHGIESPHIQRTNALDKPLKEIGDADRFDVIVTNPPFGGEEEAGIQLNFPEATRTSETALLFMQFIMRSLKPQGRCALVVPNGTLFGDGVAAKVKEKLLTEFNLHTIVRLPNGVFAPYTSIPTNRLFFDRTGPTHEIWYYEQPMPEGRKNYSKTKPMQHEEWAECIARWDAPRRIENDRAWKVAASEVLKYDDQHTVVSVNLDLKNPTAQDDFVHLPPEQLAADILKKEKRIAEIMAEIQAVLGRDNPA
jgi:type I restriction enzyme M protein